MHFQIILGQLAIFKGDFQTILGQCVEGVFAFLETLAADMRSLVVSWDRIRTISSSVRLSNRLKQAHSHTV